VTALQETRVLTLKRAHIRYGKRKIRAFYETHGDRLAVVDDPVPHHEVPALRRAREGPAGEPQAHTVRPQEAHHGAAHTPLFGFLVRLDTVQFYWKSQRHALSPRSKSTVNAQDFMLRLHYLFGSGAGRP
jgi:hypothetical protein